MSNNKNNTKNNTSKLESERKPLPKSDIVGKRREVFSLNIIKEEKEEKD